MNDNRLASFQFERYSIDEIQLVRHEKFEEAAEGKMKFNISVCEGEDPNRLKLILNIEVDQNNINLSLTISGFFCFSDDTELPGSEKIKLIKMNGVAILLPYARSVVSMLTALDSPNAIVLPLMNVFEFMKDHEKSTDVNDDKKSEF